MKNSEFDKSIYREIDPEKIKLLGPIENHSEQLSKINFITKEGTKETMTLFKALVLDDTIKNLKTRNLI